MIEGIQLWLVVATALGAGLMSGAFFAFSGFVMAGLKRLPSDQGMAAMQEINITAVTPAFMIAFMGTAVASVAVAATAIVSWEGVSSVWLLLGAGLYLFGAFAMTATFHVPRNNALAAVSTTDPDAAQHWARYAATWTAGNHLRTVASLAAAAALTVATLV